MPAVTKRIFLESCKCLSRGWYARRLRDDLSDAERFRIEQGIKIGRLARELFPQGVLVEDASPLVAADMTHQLLADSRITAVFEATFHIDGYTTKVDILVRQPDGWKIIEVKSNQEGTSSLPALIDDLTYTFMVVTRYGVKVTGASLLLLSRSFRRGMEPSQLFSEVEQTAAVHAQAERFFVRWDEIGQASTGSECPAPVLTAACSDCPFFSTECLGLGIQHPILELPSLRPTQIEAAKRCGVMELSRLPEGFPLSQRQGRVVECVRTGRPYVGKGLREALEVIEWPAYYLDFETVMTALPLYPDLAPYTQVVTQFSIHRCVAPGQIDKHFEYLADPSQDCQRELAERLLRDLDVQGSIIVYTPFEKTQINQLARRFHDLAEPLRALVARLLDLCGVIRSEYYHQEFHGSFSIKRVLPVVVPELTYDGLEIADGGTAMVRFAQMALGQVPEEQSGSIRDSLLTYCERDTLAMVRLHEALHKLCDPSPSER